MPRSPGVTPTGTTSSSPRVTSSSPPIFKTAWIKEYIRDARRNKPEVFRRIVGHYVFTYSAQAAVLALAIGLHGLGQGVRIWAFSLGLPAFAALWTVMLFNYCQYVHADPWSLHDHSRNFEGKLLNFLLFGNGYHTVHHEQPSLHWADAEPAHAAVRPFDDHDAPFCVITMPWNR